MSVDAESQGVPTRGAARHPQEHTQTLIKVPGPLKQFGLRTQIVLGLAVVTLFAVLSTGAMALWAAADDLRQQREATATALSTAAASALASVVNPLAPLDAPENVGRLAPVLRQLLDGGGVTEISAYDQQRRVVAARPPRAPNDQDPPASLAALSGVPSVLHYRQAPGGQGTQLLAYAPLQSGGRILGLVRLSLPAPPPMIGFLAKSGSVLAAQALGNAVLLVALGYLLLTGLVVRPLRQVEQATAALGEGGPEGSIHVDGPREIVSLAHSFNRMAERLAHQREQLIRSEKLASVGQLSAGVAHEIGNPLAAILGYADLLEADANTPEAGTLSHEERRTITARIKSETQRIHCTIRDLLEYSRPNQDQLCETDPSVVIAAARALVAAVGGRARDIQVNLTPGFDGSAGSADASSPWPRVVAAPERLKQVFVNLLLNAADAMGGQGHVTVRATASAHTLSIFVHDSGPGVPPALHRRIFDPFFTTKEPGKGTGLGLSICRAIMETMDGSLELKMPSGLDETSGATFVVSLPLAPAAVKIES